MVGREARHVSTPIGSSSVSACLTNLLRWIFSQAKKASLSYGGSPIYLQAPPQLEQATRPNLAKKLSDIVPAKGEIVVTSTSLPFSLTLEMSFT